jgi:hypothetical protein
MAQPLPNRSSLRNGTTPAPRLAPTPENARNGHGEAAKDAAAPRDQGLLENDDLLIEELGQLGEKNRELLSVLKARSPGETSARGPELEALRTENAELREIVGEMNRLLESGTGQPLPEWEAKQKEYESLLEEKSEVIRELHQKLQELQQPAPPPKPLPSEGEMQSIFEELERDRAQLDAERRQIEEERGQLVEDEEALMKQMRDMEMSLARDRAELARQRNELQRLHNDIKHELELASRDGSLRDRLSTLQRRHQEINTRKGAAPGEVQKPTPAAPAPAAKNPPPKNPKENGLFRRFFGSGQ